MGIQFRYKQQSQKYFNFLYSNLKISTLYSSWISFSCANSSLDDWRSLPRCSISLTSSSCCCFNASALSFDTTSSNSLLTLSNFSSNSSAWSLRVVLSLSRALDCSTSWAYFPASFSNWSWISLCYEVKIYKKGNINDLEIRNLSTRHFCNFWKVKGYLI